MSKIIYWYLGLVRYLLDFSAKYADTDSLNIFYKYPLRFIVS
jgi:hypothetical protein